jgi:hypothetical protein
MSILLFQTFYHNIRIFTLLSFTLSTPMNTQRYLVRTSIAFFCIILASISGCKKAADTDAWTETNDVSILAYKSDPENGKRYLNIIYENAGNETYRKIKYQLFIRTGTRIDTVEKIIIPTTVLIPKDRRLVPRNIGEEEAMWDEVKVGKVWVVKDTK